MPSKTLRISVLIMFFLVFNTAMAAIIILCMGTTQGAAAFIPLIIINAFLSAIWSVLFNDLGVWLLRHFNIGVWRNE